jgi:hypothetical protein
MSKPKLCMCSHPVGVHSHLVPHACKADGCECPWFEVAE